MKYVKPIALDLGISTELIHHPRVTSSCHEKAQLLGWCSERVVKAIYAGVDEDICGFVFPEFRQRLTEDDVRSFYAQVGATLEDYQPDISSWYIPESMELGTCTPFALESDMKLVDHIFIRDVPSLDDALVDISVGGKGSEAHKTSMHLPYSGIYRILQAQYGDKIHKVN